MLQNSNLNSVMEPGDHFKNGASSKSHMSRGNIIQKLFLFLSIFCICITSAFAQDVITLKNAEEIQAIVQEIGEVEIKYKKFENPTGPNYTLKKSEIFTIKYENGSRDVFVNEVADKETVEIATTTIPATPAPISNLQNIQNQAENQLESLSIRRLRIYNSNGVRLSKYEVQNVMKDVPEALYLYNRGNRQKKTGWIIGLPGALLGIAGGIVYFSNELSDWPNDDKRDLGTGMLCTGLVMQLPGFIIRSVGEKRIKQSVPAYNKGIRQRNTSDISLNFGVTNAGGIGLVINF